MPSSQEKAGIVHALSAAFLFGISIPIAKHLIGAVPAQWLAGLLYLGSGLGLAVRTWIAPKQIEAPLKKSHLVPLAAAIVFGGVLAPVLLLQGLQRTPASSASLLLNFEAVFTGVIAWAVFGENMGTRVALGMMSIVAGGVVLSWKGPAAISGLYGPSAIIAACFCWALDNNFTQKISGRRSGSHCDGQGLGGGNGKRRNWSNTATTYTTTTSSSWGTRVGFRQLRLQSRSICSRTSSFGYGTRRQLLFDSAFYWCGIERHFMERRIHSATRRVGCSNGGRSVAALHGAPSTLACA